MYCAISPLQHATPVCSLRFATSPVHYLSVPTASEALLLGCKQPRYCQSGGSRIAFWHKRPIVQKKLFKPAFLVSIPQVLVNGVEKAAIGHSTAAVATILLGFAVCAIVQSVLARQARDAVDIAPTQHGMYCLACCWRQAQLPQLQRK